MGHFLKFVCAALVAVTPALAVDVEAVMELGKRFENKVFRSGVKPNWTEDGKSLWYKVQTGPKTTEYVLVNAATGERKTAPDFKGLGLPEAKPVRTSTAGTEMKRSDRTGESTHLKFVNQTEQKVSLEWVSPDGKRVPYGEVPPRGEHRQHTFEGHVWVIKGAAGETLAVVQAEATETEVAIDGKKAETKPAPAPRRSRGTSPDGKWSAYIEGGIVKVRAGEQSEPRTVPSELDGKSPFVGGIQWAPDSNSFVVLNTAPVTPRKYVMVESSPKDQLQPKVREITYPKPGDPLPQPAPVLFRLKNGAFESKVIKNTLFPNFFEPDGNVEIRWAPDSSEFYFDYNQRGHQAYRIIGVNAATGEARAVVEETSKTFIDYTNKTWRQWLDKTGELIWMSERDGWCHLWLYDVKAGKPVRQLTKGNWVVRKVVHVDESAREIWFLAAGLRPEQDPYYQHLCRVKLDGSGFVQLTEGDGNHRIEFSPNREYFVDTWSRVDQAPVAELRRSADGKLVSVLEKADASALVAAGWTMPERFVAKGRDGKTDIYGVIIKPPQFNPAKKYPVIEYIYAGPHSAFAPKDFGQQLMMHQYAECGYVVVQADGMGTNHRGKAFHDVCWKNIKDAGFPDRIAWMKAAANSRPWMDLSRVGIFGGSAGGQNAMRALLDYNDFYKVAVADCGCHDNRMDKIWWNEQWMGWPVDDSYIKSSNKEDAAKLKGDLLLIVGELDDNVDPASTTQVVGALQKAGKQFTFMPIIGAKHGAAESPFGARLRMRFFLQHLQP